MPRMVVNRPLTPRVLDHSLVPPKVLELGKNVAIFAPQCAIWGGGAVCGVLDEKAIYTPRLVMPIESPMAGSHGVDVIRRVNGQPVGSLNDVRERLALVADIKTDSPVILHPDESVPVGNVIDVYDATRLAGFTQIQFAIAE